LEAIVFNKAGQIGAKQIPLHHYAAGTGMYPFRQAFLLPLTAKTDLRQGRGSRRKLDHFPASTLSLAGKQIQERARPTDRYGFAKLLLKSAEA
jgi:hypothetical protein